MKIITLHTRIDPNELRKHVSENIDSMFRAQRNEELHFDVEGSGNMIEIFQRDLYEGFLYRIEVKGSELYITRSEHYTDDVNSLTIESILNDLFKDLSGRLGTDLLLEG
jgi:hypothetical protein